MIKKDIEPILIADNDFVKVVKTKKHVDVRFTERHNFEVSNNGDFVKPQQENRVVRLDKDTYLDQASGEIKEYIKKESRSDNESTFCRTKRELDWLIRNSFEGNTNEMLITLTFSEKVLDIKEANKEFNNFKRRMSRILKDKTTFEYILIREPHLDGSWHMHMLFKYELIDIDSNLLTSHGEWKKAFSTAWAKGIIDLQPITDPAGLSHYLSSHLMDIKLDKNGEEIESFTEGLTAKQVAKNQRLKLYPHNMNIYSSSKGIKKPMQVYMKYGECRELFNDEYVKNYDNSFKLFNDDFALTQRQIQLTKKDA